MDSTHSDSQGTGRNRARKSRLWLLLALPLLLGGAVAARAYAQGPGLSCPGFGPGFGPGMGAHGAFMQRGLERMLDEVKATDTQRAAIKTVAARLRTEMQPIHDEHAKLHEEMVKVFSAQTVDAAAVERLRTQSTALMEKGSQAFSRALVDAANVLNVEQRQALIKHLEERRGRGFGPRGRL